LIAGQKVLITKSWFICAICCWFYVLNIIDANVGCRLIQFNVNENLSPTDLDVYRNGVTTINVGLI
jgi:hypothetical protein